MEIHVVSPNGAQDFFVEHNEAILSSSSGVDMSEHFYHSQLFLGINLSEGARRRVSERFRDSLVLSTISFLSHSITFGQPRGMVLRANPMSWRSRSRQSGARYPAYWDLEPHGMAGGLLLQVFASSSQITTSCHLHRETLERFYPLVGKTEISCDNSNWRELDWRETNRLGVLHQLRAGCGLAINVIRMEGPHHILCTADHHYDDGTRGKPVSYCSRCRA